MSRRGEAYIQIRWDEAGTVLYCWMAIEPHRFDREGRGRGRAGPRPAHRRRACDRHDPAPVSRDVHDPRPPRDGAGLLPRAPDRKRRGLESNRCGSLRGRLRAPSLAIDSANHPVRRIQRVPAVARATFATSHRSLRERDRAAPGRRRGGRPSNLRPPLLAPSRDWARRRLRSVLRPVARTDSVRFRILRLSHRGPEPAVPPLRGCAGDLELRRDGLGRPSNRTRGAPSPTRLRRSDARAAPSGITRPGSHLLLLRGARDHHCRGDPQPGPCPPGIPRVPDRLGPVRCGAVVPPAYFDSSAHGGGEASRKRYREFEGRRGLCAAHGQEPDVGTEPPRSARPAPPHARDSPAPGGGTPNPDPADLAVRDAGHDPHRRDHLDRGRRRGGTRRGRLLPLAVEPTGHDPKFKARPWYADPGSFDALRRVRHDEQGDLPVLPVLRGLLDHGRHGGGARYSREYRFVARPPASVAPRRSPPAGVRPAAADARLRRPPRGGVLLPRPGHRLLPEW